MGETLSVQSSSRVSVRADAPISTLAQQRIERVSEKRGKVAGWSEEMVELRAQCRQLPVVDTAEAMTIISSVQARLSEIAAECWKLGSTEADNLRNHEVIPLEHALRLHFDANSRKLAAMTFEWEQSRGQM